MIHNGRGGFQRVHLGDVLGDKLALRIKPLRLAGRVEDPEVRLGIGARPRRPLPSSVVGGKIPIKKLLHEVALTPLPRDQEVLGQKGGDDHPQPVVHPPGLVELPHGCIHDRKSGLPLAPRLKEVLPVFPLHRVVFPAERAPGHVGEFPEDLLVEIPPEQLGDKDIDLFLG